MTMGIDDLDRQLAALDRGESLPARWYTDPTFPALEDERRRHDEIDPP